MRKDNDFRKPEKAIPDLNWEAFIDLDFATACFPAGAKVLDIGCGTGRHLRELAKRGCKPIGIEPDLRMVSTLKLEGFEVTIGCAESLPFEPASCDGIVCSVVIPYTDERRAISEWARVLRPGGTVNVTYHGIGYYLRYLLKGPQLKRRLYGIRTIINTWYYISRGKKLNGWKGDTLYQSERRLQKYYGPLGLRIVKAPPPRYFLGLPVFIVHRLEMSESPNRPKSCDQ